MPFTQITDGDYSSAVLLSRKPRTSDITGYQHYLWAEVWIQDKATYHPLQTSPQGIPHPDGYEDPIDPRESTSAGNIYSLASAGAGNGALYLIEEEPMNYIGNLVVFKRTYSSIPQSWSETEFGYHTFPGRKALKGDPLYDVNGNVIDNRSYIVTTANPSTLPCLIKSTHFYQLNSPSTIDFNAYPIPTYYSTSLVSNSFYGDNIVEYTGYAQDPDGDGFKRVYQHGGREGGPIITLLGNSTKVPVIDVRVARWMGPLYRVTVREVVSSLK